MINNKRSEIKLNSTAFEDLLATKDLKRKTKSGIIYTIISNGGQFIIGFIGSIILARILFPEDFGLMAIVSIVLQLATRLTNFGFSMVLIQRKQITREHLDTVFITNLCLMFFLTATVFFSAPFVAKFFGNGNIEPIVKVISFNFLLLAFTSVPKAILRRKMEFKDLEIVNTIGKIVGVVFPVGFALAGFGIWSLVFGILMENFFLSTALTYRSRWLPKFKFNFWALKDVFSFGLWVYLAGYVNYGINKIDFFVVGKILGVAQLGFYERAFNLMSLPRRQIVQKIGSVMFSSYSRLQDDKEQTVQLLSKVLLYLSLITYPLMIWMFFVAPSLISVLFGSKWIPAIIPFKIMCLAGILDTLTLILAPTVNAGGFIGHRVRRDFFYLLVLGFCVLIGTRWGINGVALGITAASILRLTLILNLVQKMLQFTIGSFFRAQKSAIIYSLCLLCSLFGIQVLMLQFASVYSVQMLVAMSVAAVLILVASHLIIRFKDVDSVLYHILLSLRVLKDKLVTFLKSLKFMSGKDKLIVK